MIVEFVGESGCGKSTLAGQVFPRVPDAKKKKSLSPRQRAKCLRRILRCPGTRELLLSVLKVEVSVSGPSRLLKDALYLAGLLNVLLEDEDGDAVWILDQGLIQYAQTIYYDSAMEDNRYPDILRRLLESGRYCFVLCRCDEQTLRERIRKRAREADAVSRRIERADETVFRLHERNLRTLLSPVPEEYYITVDTADDLQTNADRVCAFIQNRRDRSCGQKRPS